MARSILAPGAITLAAALALGGCGFGSSDDTIGITTLPTLPPSSGATTPPSTVPATTVATTAPPLTAPVGGPNTLPPIPGLETTTTSSVAATRVTYVDEPGSGALRLGHRGNRVRTMQGQLSALGYQLGIDGYFGRGTEAAVRAFQQAQGLSADGIAGPDTLARIADLADA